MMLVDLGRAALIAGLAAPRRHRQRGAVGALRRLLRARHRRDAVRHRRAVDPAGGRAAPTGWPAPTAGSTPSSSPPTSSSGPRSAVCSSPSPPPLALWTQRRRLRRRRPRPAGLRGHFRPDRGGVRTTIRARHRRGCPLPRRPPHPSHAGHLRRAVEPRLHRAVRRVPALRRRPRSDGPVGGRLRPPADGQRHRRAHRLGDHATRRGAARAGHGALVVCLAVFP